MDRYENVDKLVVGELTPIVDVLLKLSSACANFSYSANNVSNVNATESHEIKELLELVFDIRKLSEKVEDAVEDRTEKILEMLKSDAYKLKSNKMHSEEIIETNKE